MVTRDQLIEMAKESGLPVNHPDWVEAAERFAKLVRDDYSNKHAQLWLKRLDLAAKQAYVAGQLAMRDRAVDVCLSVADEYRGTTWGKAAESLGDGCASAIFALPIEVDTK